jgi:hypothetical protein
MTKRAYDNPHLAPRGFYLAIMHDLNLPLTVRMEAASQLMHHWPDLYAYDYAPAYTVIIPGITLQ